MSDLSDFLPDFSDPKQMALWGALGGLARSGAPQFGPNGKPISGMGPGTGLMGILGNVLGGTVAGAGGAQEYQKTQLGNTGAGIGNQMAQLGLERQQAIQPYQLDMMKKYMSGQGMPGSLSGGGGNVQDWMQYFNNALGTAYASGDMKQISEVNKSIAENLPQLIGAKELAKAGNSVVQTPNGPQLGYGGLPGAPQAPSLGPGAQQRPEPIEGTQPPIVPVQGPQQLPPPMSGNDPMPPNGGAMPQIPPMNASQLNPPDASPLDKIIQAQKGAMNGFPNTTVGVAAAKAAAEKAAEIAAAGPKAEAEATGKNTAEADKAVAAILGRLPSAYGIVDDMTNLAPDVPSGPMVEHQRDFFNAIKSPKATAYDRFNKFNENLFTQELPAIVQNSGGRIDIPLVKAIQGASQVPLDAQPKTKIQLLKDTKDLLAKVKENALSTYKAQTGKEFDLSRAFTTPDQIKMAFKKGIIDQPTAEKMLQAKHGYGQ